MNTYLTPKELLPVPYLPSTFGKEVPATIPWDTLAAMIKTDQQLKAKVELIRAIRASGTEKDYAKAKAMVGGCVSGFKMPQNALAAPEMPEPHVNQNQQHPVKRIYLPSESISTPQAEQCTVAANLSAIRAKYSRAANLMLNRPQRPPSRRPSTPRSCTATRKPPACSKPSTTTRRPATATP